MARGKVRDIMTSSVDIVDMSDSIANVAKRMAERDFGAAPVCDSGRLLGMITDRDITTKVVGIVSQGDLAVSMPDQKVGDLVESISAAP